MPLDLNGNWYPNLSVKQLEVYNDRHRALLVEGPRKSGKTIGVLHRIVRHLWETPGARVAMFSRVMKKAKEGGTWNDLHEIILPQWFKADIGMRYTTFDSEGNPGAKIAGDTRTPYFRVANWHGVEAVKKGESPGLFGESEVKLFSMDVESNIESRLMEKRFSMIYFSELANFFDPRVLSVSLAQLRMYHLKREQQSWIADTNPSEEGEFSWIYETFHVLPGMTYDEYKDWQTKRGLPVLSEELFIQLKDTVHCIRILPADNPFLDKREFDEIKITCARDVGLYKRHVDGEWVYGDGNKSLHFSGYFFPNIHVIGHCDGPEEDHIIPLPSEHCTELVLGFDLGDVNHSAHILERIVLPDPAFMFIVLAELVSIGQEVSNADFTVAFMLLIEDFERRLGRSFKLRAWSDPDALEKYSASGDAYPYQQVLSASSGRIMLEGVRKGKGSAPRRVQMMKDLLGHTLKADGQQQRPVPRVLFGANCTATIKAIRELKKGKTTLNYIVPDGNQHPFDSVTYAILGELGEELEFKLNLQSRARSGGSGLIQIS